MSEREKALESIAVEFVRRVEAGEVRSKRTYAAFKMALAMPATEQGVDVGFDDATADKVMGFLCDALGVQWPDVEMGDGTETWDGDVRVTVTNILKAARVYDDEDGRVARLEDAAQGVDLLRGWEAGRDAAKKAAGDYCWQRTKEAGVLKSPAVFTTHTWQDIQQVIASLTPPEDAPWAPPPEAERPEGYRCLAWDHIAWRVIIWDDGAWWTTEGGKRLQWVPEHFLPYPPAPEDAP